VGHNEAVRREFANQAPGFEDPGYVFANARFMAWIQEHMPPRPHERVLDVAGGTGRMARAYADVAAVAVVLDLTDEMIAVGQEQARAENRSNVVYVRGDAAAMPFVDRAFELVLSRFAVHHFERPELQIGEMVRVCCTGGRIGIVDIVAADPGLAEQADRLERMRDPSHTRALPAAALRALLEDADACVVHEAFHDRRLGVDSWLAQALTPEDVAEAIRAELRAELDGGPATGLRPFMHDGELCILHRDAVIVAEK
jgi:SAM-dependent methyltransferase